MHLCIAVCLPFLPAHICCFAGRGCGGLGLGPQPAYPWAEDLVSVSCLVPGQQLSWTR